MIRTATTADAAAICAIYNHYVTDSIITFEETPVLTDDMAGRIAEVLEAPLPWLVFAAENGVLGYAYASAWKSRCAYRFAVEATVYIAPGATGGRLGTQLYEALIADLRTRSLHCVIGGVALPNAASVALHEKLGFEKVAHFKQVGRKFDRWIDVGYWELMF
ncbi:phosphinothricin acetyltransferase [Verrucomicrobia bacterium SCGC AG-212-E04]|nr:phosphinothricin acetyltransferase [Verrucomicrobia bacterium SCGC AG-212-E04]